MGDEYKPQHSGTASIFKERNTLQKKKILIAGYYGFKNTGDEAILSSMLASMRKEREDITFIVISGNPLETEKNHRVQAIHWQNVQQISRVVRTSDLVIIGGGGLFQDYWGAGTNSLLTPEHAGISYYSGICFLAAMHNKPFMLYAVGVGPLLSAEGRELTRLTFLLAKAATVRDMETRNLLDSLNIAVDRIRVTNDPALTLHSDTAEAERILKKAGFIPTKKNTVGVNVRNWDFGISREEWCGTIAAVLDRFIEKYRAQLLFIPFQMGETELEDDPSIAHCIIDKMEHQENILALSEAYSAETIAGFVACTSLMIGMRLHSLVFAAKEAVPVVGLAYDAKVDNFLRSMRLSDYSIDIQSVKIPAFFELLEKAWQNQDKIREHLAEIINTNKPMLRQNAVSALALLTEAEKETMPDNVEPIRSIVRHQVYAMTNKERIITEQDAKIRSLEQELRNITTSKVWLTAKALQNVQAFVLPTGSRRRRTAKQMFSYFANLANYVHGKMPLQLQRKSAPIVAKFAAAFSLPKKIGRPEDITWEEFSRQILAHRDAYKGIFIQKAVIDWGVPLYQRPQHMASTFGKLGYLVIYQTDNSTVDDVDGFRNIGNNIWLTNSKQVNTIEGAVHSVYSTAYDTGYELMKGFKEPGSWTNKNNIFLYEYIDHIDPKITASDDNVKTLLKLKEFAFNGAADYIIASAEKLEQEAIDAVGKKKVVSVPNGVELEHYREFDCQAIHLPAKYTRFRKKYGKVVGYFGALAPWLWYRAINRLARTRSDLGFIFIGPDYLYGSTKLAKLDNLLYLGPINYDILPAYAYKFDVCFIPFEPGEIARTTSPLKLFEYFALEKPVVTTSFMDECVDFDEVFHGDSVETLSKAIDKAFSVKDDPTYKARLGKLAEQNSWTERAERLEFIFEELKIPVLHSPVTRPAESANP